MFVGIGNFKGHEKDSTVGRSPGKKKVVLISKNVYEIGKHKPQEVQQTQLNIEKKKQKQNKKEFKS